MNYATIKKMDIANGPGVRVSLFVSGCRHKCPGCFNAEAWDFSYGAPYTEAVEKDILDAVNKEHLSGLSFLGGEPFERENRDALAILGARFHALCPEKTLWCYSGFTFEELYADEGAHPLLSVLDVLVDGKFEMAKKDLSLLFRGSSNQRILDVKKSLACGKAVWLDGVWERAVGSNDISE